MDNYWNWFDRSIESLSRWFIIVGNFRSRSALMCSFYRLSRDFARGSEKKLNPFVRASLREKSSPKFRRVAGTRHNYSSKHGSTSLSSEKKNSKYSSRHRFKPGLGNFSNRGITFDISERLLKLPRLNITSYVS